MRFTRDKRGYENTYVVHSVKRRGKSHQRILYWFRSPPNVRVGRTALDAEAIRVIEEHNPGVAFDWSKILEGQAAPAPAEPVERRRRPREGGAQSQSGGATSRVGTAARAQEPAPAQHTPSATQEMPAPLELVEPVPQQFEAPPERIDVPIATSSGLTRVTDAISTEGGEPPEIEPPVLVPVTVYHGGADVLVAGTPEEPRLSPAEARLGSDQLNRLRVRYAEIVARITQRGAGDPIRLEELRRAAELLNPDTWVTEQEIANGVQRFDARLGDIRRALGIKRRRRSRRGGRRRRLAKQPSGSAIAPSEAAPQVPELEHGAIDEAAGLDEEDAADGDQDLSE